MIKDDGDIVRGCGFVGIYFGNLEEELRELYEHAQNLIPELGKHEKLRFTSRCKHLRKALVRKIGSTPKYGTKERDESMIISVLRRCQELAKQRNRLIHGSIVSNRRGGAVIRHKNKKVTEITSKEVYILANEVSDMQGSLYGLQFSVNRLRKALGE